MREKKRLVLTTLVALIGYVAFKYVDREETPVVSISNGNLVGFVSRSREGREFFQFLGVPYGKAPLGQLRFEPPLPAEKWEGVRKAKKFASMCIHVNSINRNIEGDEDCLFLNIFCPKFRENQLWEGKLLPVFVYIHGGYFMAGGSNYMGPMYLLQEDIILVTINYRLNSFGFLNTGDGTVSGNMGMKDQVLALQFVQKEIKHFGGDPDNIILWGESAGAAAVHFHLLSPMSKGLFKKAIMSSGTAIKPWSLAKQPEEQAKLLAKSVDCPTYNISGMVECLKAIDARTLVMSHADALQSPIMNPLKIFAPSIEVSRNGGDKIEQFLSEHPYDILRGGRAHRVPLLTGVNSHEGLLATARMYFNSSLAHEVASNWDDLAPTFFSYDKKLTSVTSKIREFYFGQGGAASAAPSSDQLNFSEKFSNFTNVFSDRWYIHSQRETVHIQSQHSPVYLYYFTHRLERGLIFFYDLTPNYPIEVQIALKVVLEWWGKLLFDFQPPQLGTCHGDELVLLYNFPMVYIDVGEPDYELSRLLIKTWIQFAYDESKLSVGDTLWPSAKPKESLKYMHISSDTVLNGAQLIDEPFLPRMQFWDSLNLPWKV